MMCLVDHIQCNLQQVNHRYYLAWCAASSSDRRRHYLQTVYQPKLSVLCSPSTEYNISLQTHSSCNPRADGAPQPLHFLLIYLLSMIFSNCFWNLLMRSAYRASLGVTVFWRLLPSVLREQGWKVLYFSCFTLVLLSLLFPRTVEFGE